MEEAQLKIYFSYVVIAIGLSLLPLICLTYLVFRLPARREQLTSLFKSNGILPAYLKTRGHRIPPDDPSESYEDHRKKLESEFDKVFSLELGQEYGGALYAVPLIAATITTAITVWFLVREAAGEGLFTDVPLSVSYALLGAFAGSVYDMISRYARTDLNPISIWWIPFRYLMAIAYGLLANLIFSTVLANLGSFMLGLVPITQALDLVRSKSGLVPNVGQDLDFRLIQGLDATTIDTLSSLGVSHVQHLAYADPLRLLVRSNFSPNQLADWMDQCFLFCYAGSKTENLRIIGIRGAIEVMDLQDLEGAKRTTMIAAFAERLGVSSPEAENLVEEFAADAQLALIDEIWGTGDETKE